MEGTIKVRCVYSVQTNFNFSMASYIGTIPIEYVKHNAIILTQELMNTLVNDIKKDFDDSSEIMLISINFYGD